MVPGHVDPRPDEDEATRMCKERGLDFFTLVETRFYFICQTTLQGYGCSSITYTIQPFRGILDIKLSRDYIC